MHSQSHRFASLMFLVQAGAFAACAPATEGGVFAPHVFAIHGVAIDGGASGAAIAAEDLAPFILYKSAACPDPGADTCLDERAAGFMLSEMETYALTPLSGASLPSDEFVRGSETSWANVQFTNAEHPDATWSYGLLLLAPHNNHETVDLDGASIDAMPDSTPFALGGLVIETHNISDEELAARGLNPADAQGHSVTVVSLTTEAPFDPIAADTVISFPVRLLGDVRDELVFPSLFDDEALHSLAALQ